MDIINNLNTFLAIDFQKIFLFIVLYLVVLWILICVWVYIDSKKRFKSKQLAIIFFMMCLLLNFPALLFYIIIRPEIEDEHVFFMHSDHETHDLGGVNVPIVNFIGEDGFKISLQLNVANPKTDKNSNLNIGLDWKSDDEGMQVQERPAKKEAKLEEVIEVKEVKANKFSNIGQGFKSKINGAKTKVTLSMKNLSKKKEKSEPEAKVESSVITEPEAKVESPVTTEQDTKAEEVATESTSETKVEESTPTEN